MTRLPIEAGANPLTYGFHGKNAFDWTQLHQPTWDALGQWRQYRALTPEYVADVEVKKSIFEVAQTIQTKDSSEANLAGWEIQPQSVMVAVAGSETSQVIFSSKNTRGKSIFVCGVCESVVFCTNCMTL